MSFTKNHYCELPPVTDFAIGETAECEECGKKYTVTIDEGNSEGIKYWDEE